MKTRLSKSFQTPTTSGRFLTLYFLLMGIFCCNLGIQKTQAKINPPCMVCQGNITLNTQAQVDALNCTEISGNLTIDGSAIEGLVALNGLLKIGGNLRITNTSVQSLDGLENLEFLGGDLYLRNNDQMNLFFSAAFEQGVKFKFNTLNGSLTVFDNRQLLSMGGLGNLKTIKGFMDVFSNASLSNLQGLENLEEIQTLKNSPIALQFVGNPSLSRFFALTKLRKVGGNLNIVNNALQSLEELANLEILEGNLQIIGNNFLDECCSIAHLVAKAPQNADIKVNANGCNSTSEVIFGCGAFGIKEFQLVNAQSKQVIRALHEGDTINLQALGGAPLNFRALTQPNQIGSVIFKLSGAKVFNNTENLLPYELFGDAGGNLEPGSYTLEAIPYSAAKGQGTQGKPLTLHFVITDQKICQGDVLLDTQEKVNQCACTEITGNLTIEGAGVYDLYPLNKLRKIGGNLNVRNTKLAYLDGLGNLESLGGDFDIRFNQDLILLFSAAIEQGLKFKLDKIGGSISFIANNNLFSIAGLDNIKSVGGFVDLIANGGLLDLRGLRNLEEINNLVQSKVGLQLFGNNQLYYLGGLEKLRKINGDLIIIGTQLPSLGELSQVEFLGGGLRIESNRQLNDCCGIAHLLSKSTGITSIKDNAGGCNTPTEIIFKCGTFSVEKLLLVNTSAKTVIDTLRDGAVVDLNQLDDILLNIRAITQPTQVGSVKLTLTGAQNLTRVENIAPYEIFGDLGGTLVPGKYTLEAIPFTQALAKGISGKPLLVHFEIKVSSTCPGDLTLSTQAEVDNFDCEEVSGNLTIKGKDINFLGPLNKLRKIKGNLRVENTNLYSLDGLKNLEYLGGNIDIRDNLELGTLLSQARESLDAQFAFRLDTIHGAISLLFNPKLDDLEAFANVKVVEGFIDIFGCHALFNLGIGFRNLEEIQAVKNSPKGSALQFFGNNDLRSITGLNKLRKLGGDLVIVGNRVLGNINSLANIEVLQGDLIITDNTFLSDCCAIGHLIKRATGRVDIQNNGTNCNSANAIPANCTLLGPISVEKLNLINNLTGEVIKELKDGDVVDLTALGNTPVNIRALTKPSKVGSVLFTQSSFFGPFIIENIRPYDFFGDNGGQLAPGRYTLTVTPYSQERRTGFAGRALSLSFEIINQSLASKADVLTLSPNPSEDYVKLKIGSLSANESGMVIIYNAQGKIVYEKDIVGDFEDEVNLLEFGKGLYIVKYIQNGKEELKKIMIR